ncbi:MAG: hypothetical protein WBN11_03980 [Eudoraea sp.]|uniref:hypothetical protein n=1 Tax=Eudoraea sp. TaxID=1979955 RepID=UPI003C7149B6
MVKPSGNFFFLLIIGIFLLIALPNLKPLIIKAKSLEAQTQLKAIHNTEKTYNYMYSKYSNDSDDFDFIAPKTAGEDRTANYRYEIIREEAGSFKAGAQAVINFNEDGIFNVWEIDKKGNPKHLIKDL